MTPQVKRRVATERRLWDALDRLVARVAEAAGVANRCKLTIVALAREAGIGCNAIHANHREITPELQRAIEQCPPPAPIARLRADSSDCRAAAAELRAQNQLITIDNAALLKRVLDAERAGDWAEKKNAMLTAELRRMQQPTQLHSWSKPSA